VLGDWIAQGTEVVYDYRMTLGQPRTALAAICFCTTCGVAVSAGMGLLPGCAGSSANPGDVAPSDAAVNICSESVPADHIVDGIPADASCDAALAAVYSNNGVNTRTTSGGADWVRTYGQEVTGSYGALGSQGLSGLEEHFSMVQVAPSSHPMVQPPVGQLRMVHVAPLAHWIWQAPALQVSMVQVAPGAQFWMWHPAWHWPTEHLLFGPHILMKHPPLRHSFMLQVA
jgi:hypothetical protein